MSLLSRLASLVRNLLFKTRVDQDLDDELRAYVEMTADEKRGAGMTDANARRSALVELGGFEQYESQSGTRDPARS